MELALGCMIQTSMDLRCLKRLIMLVARQKKVGLEGLSEFGGVGL